MRNVRTERWWWLGGFLLLSVLLHVLLALHGPGFGLKGYAPSSKEIELTLEPLPPPKKPPAPKPKVAARPEPLPKVIKEVPKVAAKPVKEKRVARAIRRPVTPVRVARATLSVKPAVRPAQVVLPEDVPEATPAAHADTPKITRVASARTGLAGGASGRGHSMARGIQTSEDQPQDNGLAGGMHFPKIAAHIGGESVMSVKNPLAEDAVPEEKPGFSAGAGGGLGIGRGRGRGGLDGKLLASLRGGHGPGLGGGLGGGG